MNRALVLSVSALVTPAYGTPDATSEVSRLRFFYTAAAYLPFLGAWVARRAA